MSDKTGCIVFGAKRYKEEISKQLKHYELILGNFPVKRKQFDRYLGQILHTDGVRACVEATIGEEKGN